MNPVVVALSCVTGIVWLVIHHGGVGVPPTALTVMALLAVFGACGLMMSAAELLQFEFSGALAIPVVALGAMIPAYVIAIYLAVQSSGSTVVGAIQFVLDVQEMLLGIGWFAVLGGSWLVTKQPHVLVNVRMRIELISLLSIVIYWFFMVVKRSAALYDSVVLIIIFIVYIRHSLRTHAQRAPIAGRVATSIAQRSPWLRRLAALVASAAALWILIAALDVLAVLALPIGSRSLLALMVSLYMIIAVVVLAVKLRPHIGLAALVSAAINQMSLLIAIAIVARCIATGVCISIPLRGYVASSLFFGGGLVLYATVALLNLKLVWYEAVFILCLFAAQLMVHSAAVDYVGGGLCVVLSAVALIRSRMKRNGLRHTMRAAWRVPQDPSFNHLAHH